MNRLCVCLSLWTTVFGAQAEDFMVLGRAVSLEPPPGYCALGGTLAEREFVAKLKALMEPAGQLLQVTVPCADLLRASAGAISRFPRTATVMVVKTRGNLRLDPRTREHFLKSLGASAVVDVSAANGRLRSALANTGTAGSLASMTPLGSDDRALYWTAVGTMQVGGGEPQKAASVMAALLINGLPLGIQATEAVGNTDGPAPATVAQRYVNAIVERNER